MEEAAPPASPATPLGRLRTRWADARKRWWVRWGTDVLLIVLVVVGIGAFQTRGHLSGVPAPAFELPTLDGKQVSLASLNGKPTLVAFWAPWCTVCKSESWNIGFVRKLAGDRANVISVATAFDDVSEVRFFAAKQKVEYPVLLAPGDDVRAQYRVEAFPTVYFVGADGTVKRSVVGYTTTLGLLWRLLL